eukprot:GFUD01039994.1.p1 GENE.GFUD01039994.1~~GFUD01039994.1.p1  ORF type:complete len:254 (+),score=83.96 GFUD01039994.1:165-926(+)
MMVSKPIGRNCAKKSVKTDKVERETATKASSILDIPPEKRRKPRPVFGGLKHFNPDWVRGVRRYHKQCRIPQALENSCLLKPKNSNDIVSSQDLLAIERGREKRTVVAHITSPDLVTVRASTEEKLSRNIVSTVETMLENSKKLHEVNKMGWMDNVAFMKKKNKRMSKQPVHGNSQDTNCGLLPTPGLPLPKENTKENLVESGFGNFRRYTLLKYLDNSSGDQKPDLDYKTSWQSSMTRTITRLRESLRLDKK